MNRLYLFAIVAVTPFLSACESMKAMDKALYSIADGVAPEDTVTGQRSLNTTDRPAQIAKGNAPIDELIAKAKAENVPLNEEVDAQQYDRLQRIFKRIHAVSHFADEDWQLVFTPSSQFNAFVTGGTYIVVHQGLLDGLETDDEIAAVLGHEMAHVAAGHIFERQAHQNILALTGKKSIKQEGYTEAFTSINEQEADRVGILYAALAGYDPYAASNVWTRFAAKSETQWSYFRDHPADNERAVQTKETASKVADYYTAGELNPQHAELLGCNSLWCKKDKQIAAGEGGGLVAAVEGVLDTMTKNEQAKAERARQQTEMARQQYEQRIGRKLPSYYSYATPDAQVIKLNKPYKGVTTYNNRPVKGKTQTWFMQNHRGEIEGIYTEMVGYEMVRGKLTLQRKVSETTYEFQWANNGLTGSTLLEFSTDGTTFDGTWNFHQNPNIGGTWSGKTSRY